MSSTSGWSGSHGAGWTSDADDWTSDEDAEVVSGGSAASSTVSGPARGGREGGGGDCDEGWGEDQPTVCFRPFGAVDDRLTVEPPQPRSGHAQCPWGQDRVLYYGGLGVMPEFMNDVIVLDIATRTMTTLEAVNPREAPMPSFGAAIAVLPDGESLLVYGGQPHLNMPLGTLHTFNLRSRLWRLQRVHIDRRRASRQYRWGHTMLPLPDAVRPLVVAAHPIPADAPAFLVFAGDSVDGNSLDDVVVLFRPRSLAEPDLWSVVWHCGPQTDGLRPDGRRRATVAAYRDEFFFYFGGRSQGRTFNDMWLYSPVVNRWAQVTPSVPPELLALLLNNPVHRADDMDVARGLQVELFTKINEAASCLPATRSRRIPRPRTGHSMFILFETLWVFTGFNVHVTAQHKTLEALNDLWSLDLKTFEWCEVLPSRAAAAHYDSVDGVPPRLPAGSARAEFALAAPAAAPPCSGPRVMSMGAVTPVPGTNAVVTWGGRCDEAPLFDGFVLNVWPRPPLLRLLAQRWLLWGSRLAAQVPEYASHRDLTKVIAAHVLG